MLEQVSCQTFCPLQLHRHPQVLYCPDSRWERPRRALKGVSELRFECRRQCGCNWSLASLLWTSRLIAVVARLNCESVSNFWMTEDPVDGLSSAKSMALAHNRPLEERESMLLLLQEVVQEVGVGGSKDGEGLLRRTRGALASKVPRFKRAVKDSSLDLVQWMRRGGPWRAFLVTVVGLIALVALTGLTVFTIFFLIATANTIIVSFLMSVAAFGAFVTTFFTSLAVIYVGAVSIAAATISTITFFSILAIVFASGSVGFLWLLWQGVRRAFGTVSAALSAVSGSRRTQFVPVEKRRYSLSR